MAAAHEPSKPRYDGPVIDLACLRDFGIAGDYSQKPIISAPRHMPPTRRRTVPPAKNVVAIEPVGLTMKRLLRFLRKEDGPTAVEYAVMLALVIIVCMAGVQALTRETAASYNRSSDAINTALNSD